MDDNRIVTGLGPTQQAKPSVQRSGAAGNDLEDSGGPGYQRLRRKPREDRGKQQPAESTAQPPEEDPALELIDNLERQRATDEAASASREDLRRLRGLHHYREKDPETSRFFRRRKDHEDNQPPHEDNQPPG